jgi:choline dehydrogenase-like flavoprotein
VLVLEKGPRYARQDFRHDEVGSMLSPGFFQPLPEVDPHVLVDGATASAPTLTSLGWTARCVGGGTTHMGATFLRLHPDDFRLRSRLGEWEAIADWPYSYDELERYYGAAEWMTGVSGLAGSNTFEGPRSTAYPMPPLDSHPVAGDLDAACRGLGWDAFPAPRAVNSRPFSGRPACSYCALCSGYGCPTGARGGTAEAILPRAEATGRCEVRPDAMVREITVDRDGRASGCIYLDTDGREHEVAARAVCVSCSAVESARLLLASRSPMFPDGLGNSSGLVGRNLQFQAGSWGRATFRRARHPEKSLHRPDNVIGRAMMNHYFPPAGAPLPKGGMHLFDFDAPEPIGAAQRVALQTNEPIVWGTELKRRLHERFRAERDVIVEVFHDFVANEGTFVSLDPVVTDRHGLPAARINLAQPRQQRAIGEWLLARGLDVLERMGADRLVAERAGYVKGIMAHGTCRAGHDRRHAVLNAFCQSHDVPNLFVVDGSFMPTSGGVPTTLTIIANSLRTADYFVDRARAGEVLR